MRKTQNSLMYIFKSQFKTSTSTLQQARDIQNNVKASSTPSFKNHSYLSKSTYKSYRTWNFYVDLRRSEGSVTQPCLTSEDNELTGWNRFLASKDIGFSDWRACVLRCATAFGFILLFCRFLPIAFIEFSGKVKLIVY